MEKEVVRKSISFPVELERNIAERAKESRRSFSAQVVYDMNAYINMIVEIDLTEFNKPFKGTSFGYKVEGEKIETEE